MTCRPTFFAMTPSLIGSWRPGRRLQEGIALLETLTVVVSVAVTLLALSPLALVRFLDAPLTAEQYLELQVLGAPTCKGRALVREFARQHTEASAHELAKIRTKLGALNQANSAADARRKILGESMAAADEVCAKLSPSVNESKEEG